MDNLYCKIMTSSAKPDGVDEFEHGYLNQSFGYLPSAIKAGESGNHKMGTFFFLPDDEMDTYFSMAIKRLQLLTCLWFG